MKKSKMILILLAVVFILAGTAMVAGAYISLVNDATSQIAALEFHEETHTITEPFTKLNIHTINSSIEILPSSDGVCRIVCDDSEKLYHSFSVTESVQGVQLNINQRDDWQWYEMLDDLYRQDDIALRIYLPEAEYVLVHAYSASGDITIAPDFRFQTVNTYTASGNTKLTDLHAEHLTVHSVSGDMALRSIDVKEDVFVDNVSGFTRLEHITAVNITTSASSGNTALEYITSNQLRSQSVSGQMIVYFSNLSNTSYFETGSGSIEIVDSECGEQTVEAVSGSVTLQNVRGASLNARSSSGNISVWEGMYSGNVLCHTISGFVRFTGLDGENLEFNTSSGDVSGNLLSAKNFITETTSGYAVVPPSDRTAGTCHICTISGNINIAIEP